MKKILKRTLATVLTAVILFGAVPFGPFNLSTKADAVNISSPSLNTTEQLFKDFIINKDYLDFELTAFDIWYDQDLTNLEYKFFVYDFDLDSDKELIMQTSVYYHQDFAFFKVKNNEVIMIDDTALYKGGFDSLIKNSKYNGLVCHCGVGMYCEYYDINGAQQFERTNYNGKISYENRNMSNDLYKILSDEYLDSNGNFVNDNLTPIFWCSADEIELLGWNEFFNPSWRTAYYKYLSNNEWISNYTSDYSRKEMAVFDLYNDGIPEVAAVYQGDIWADYTIVFLSYCNGKLNIEKQCVNPENTMGKIIEYINEQSGCVIIGRTRGKVIHDYCNLSDDGKLNIIKTYAVVYFENHYPGQDLEQNQKDQMEYNSIMENMKPAEYVPINEDTLIYFFGEPKDVPDFTQNFWIGGAPGSVTLNFKNSWFDNDSINYNHELCQFTSKFAMLGYDQGDGKGNHTENFNELRTGLEKCKFNDIVIDKESGKDRVDYFIANRKIKDSNGKIWNLVFAEFIGTNTDQWYTDFEPGTGDIHEGFSNARNYVYVKLLDYIEAHNFNRENTKILLTGHSRGAATANLLGAMLIEKQNFATPENIYTYTFATPNVTTRSDKYNYRYLRIFNIVNPEDFVTKCMPSLWGYGRYGRTFTLPSKINTANYETYNSNMQDYYRLYRDGNQYNAYVLGEITSNNAMIELVKSFPMKEMFYTIPAPCGSILYTPYQFFQNVLCPIVANTDTVKTVTAFATAANALVSPITAEAYKYILAYFIEAGALTNKFSDAHLMATYCAYVCSMDSELESKEFGSYMGIVNCPVDVEIYDKSTNEIVGRIKNNVVDETIAAKDNSIVMTVDGDSKRFWLPSDGEYDVKLVGNDTGTMDYTVATVDSDKGETERVNFFDVAVTDKLTLTSQMSGDDFELDSYSLKYSNGKTLKPTEYTKDISNVNITVKTDGNGLATESMSVKSGDYVILIATPNKNYEFIGWHKGGKLVSTDMTYSLVAKEDVTFTAKFTEYALGDVNADENINSSDALLILQHSVGQITLTGDRFTRADVTKDKIVNSSDALKILQYSVGQINKF